MNPSPEVLDLLVVGGGPGGTAAAFRAAEHGLKVVVVDYDDLMKRIRDYSKDKLILPGFGGGDTMAFPKGGRLISSLAFEPIDKDEMCARWKGLYQEHGVTARTGVELTGLERRDDGSWLAQGWDHRGRCDATFTARNVVLALGRGVPRRFDIPGNTDGIAFRLDDPNDFVDRSACVIGGGTSAAEAVIALSNAKAAAGDPTGVYWSYRGDRMPRVSKALAEVFFSAYIGNGNIRYFPQSEPAGVVTAADRREYLAIRTDRRVIDGRPNETTHLEFPKESCVACIGEDIPEPLLAGIGCPLICGGPKGRKRVVVNRYLETRLSGVYVVGDLLSQAYFETDDFDADPAGFREVKHRGNIKSALRDGVLVADVLRARLAGEDPAGIAVEDAAPAAGGEAARIAVAVASQRDSLDDGPPEASLGADRAAAEGGAMLIRILPGGVEGEEFPLPEGQVTTLGRAGCDANFPDDSALSPQHASIVHGENGFSLRDDGSATGLFLELQAADKRDVRPGDLIRCGQQFLRLDDVEGEGGEGTGPGFTHFDARGQVVGRHRLAEGTSIIGRRAPDVTLDRKDRTLSRRQLALTVTGGRIQIKDLKSANGSFLRVRDAVAIDHGDRFRAGQQRFLVSLRDDPALSAGVDPANSTHASLRPAEVAAVAPAAGAGNGPSVTFEGLGKTIAVAAGQTLCEAAEAAGIPIVAECHSGICGSDPIRIVTGRENLDAEPDDQEIETLEELCEVEPGPCRLACKLRVTGPVTVKLL
ncbi:MAG: FAD-dependent oxidoreductase [Acidobacteriota bacterium]